MGGFVRIFPLLVLAIYLANVESCGRDQSQTRGCSDYECEEGTCVQIGNNVYRSCVGSDCPDELRRKKRAVGRFVYRILRDDEFYYYGLTAKNPDANRSVQSHVGCGSRPNYQSQYISTTANYQAAVDWARGRRAALVEIDLEVLTARGNNIIDLSEGDSNLLPGVVARNFARRYAEVLIEGFVPPEAIHRIVWLDHDEQGRDRCHC